MKILAFSDIHSAYRKVETIIKTEQFDMMVIAGDITNIGTLDEVKVNLNKWKQATKNLLVVVGNMDLPQHDLLISNLGYSLNARGVIIEGIGFFGCSAAPVSPLMTSYEISEQEILEVLKKGYGQIKDARKKVLVSHSPPYGTKVDIIRGGIHVGSKAIREFIENNKVDLVICGHIHEGVGKDKVGNTKIVNCGSAAMLNYAKIEIINDRIEIANKKGKF